MDPMQSMLQRIHMTQNRTNMSYILYILLLRKKSIQDQMKACKFPCFCFFRCCLFENLATVIIQKAGVKCRRAEGHMAYTNEVVFLVVVVWLLLGCRCYGKTGDKIHYFVCQHHQIQRKRFSLRIQDSNVSQVRPVLTMLSKSTKDKQI